MAHDESDVDRGAVPRSRWWWWPLVRIAFAFLGFSALVTEVATLVARGRFRAGDFFSYFTVEANTAAVISLVVGAVLAVAGQRSRIVDLVRGAVALYMTTVILIFIVLLSGYPASELTAVPWDNTVLHYVMPIAVLLDWALLTRPAHTTFRTGLTWLAVPLAYLVYSLVRGPVAHWYPYPFMDPALHGYAGVALTSVVIAVVLAAVTAAVVASPRWAAR